MKPQDFIIDRLERVFNRISGIKIRYENRTNTCSHIVEVTPLVIFENDECYLNLEEELEHDFEELFPNESILFVSEESLTEVNNSCCCKFGFGQTFESFIEYNEFKVESDLFLLDFVESDNFAKAA